MKRNIILVLLVLIGSLLHPGTALAEEVKENVHATYTVYYFFSEPRCRTCTTIESLTGDTVQTVFEDEIASGLLTWKPVDTDQAENKHYIDDFKLFAKSVVITEQTERRGCPSRGIAKESGNWFMNPRNSDAYIADSVRSFMAEKITMGEMATAVSSALWLGILTSISPCPLATNIAAVSFIGRELENPVASSCPACSIRPAEWSAMPFLGILLVTSLMAVFDMAGFLQKTMNQALGFILFATGLILLRIIPLPTFTKGSGDKVARKLASSGLIGSFLLGGMFALSFCPVSAALFFGSLIPLAIKFESGYSPPLGLRSGYRIAVLIFALAIGMGTHAVARAFNRIRTVEKWIRIGTRHHICNSGTVLCIHVSGSTQHDVRGTG